MAIKYWKPVSRHKRKTETLDLLSFEDGPVDWSVAIADEPSARLLRMRIEKHREQALAEAGLPDALGRLNNADYSDAVAQIMDENKMAEVDWMIDLPVDRRLPIWPILSVDLGDGGYWTHDGQVVYIDAASQMPTDWNDVWRWAMSSVDNYFESQEDTVDVESVVTAFVESLGPELEGWVRRCALPYDERQRTPGPVV